MALPSLSRGVQAGLDALKGLARPVRTGGGMGDWGRAGWGFLPGAQLDYRREAGQLWRNGLVLTCLNWYAVHWTEAPAVVYRLVGDQEEIAAGHEALKLLREPSPDYDRTILWCGVLASLFLDGNAYLYRIRTRGNRLAGFQYVPHFRMAPAGAADGPLISHYVYQVDGRRETIPAEEIVHLRWPMPDPENERRGLSPLSAELRAICTDNEIQTFHAALLRGMGVPGAILSPKDPLVTLEPAQAEAIKSLWREKFTGDRRGEPFVNSIGLDVQQPGFSPRDMELGTLQGLIAPRITAAFGLDPMVLGLPSASKTYSNYGEALEAATERLIALQRVIDDQFTAQVMREFPGAQAGDRFGRDYRNVRALQPDAEKLFRRLTVAVGGPWLTPDEARHDAGFEDLPGGAGAQLYPARNAAGTPRDGDRDGTIQEGQPGVPADDEKARLPRWRRARPAARPW